jgi:hypothetical protein
MRKLRKAEITGNEAVIQPVGMAGPLVVVDALGELYACANCPRVLVEGPPEGAREKLLVEGGGQAVLVCPNCETPNELTAADAA